MRSCINFYSASNIISAIKSRRMRWVGLVIGVKETRNAYKITVGKPEDNSPVERPRLRWE
jgi:hypothetical protein